MTRARVVGSMLLAWCVAVAVLWQALPAHAGGSRAGDAIVVVDPDSDQALGHGGSSDLFSLKLPDGASCPGDSANDGYRIQGFMVPATDDPATLRYKSIQPEGEGRWGLFDEYTTSYAQILTAKQDKPGGPGMIINIPRFTLAVFPPGELEPGRYRLGIACTLYNETIRYWDSEIVVKRDPSDKPAEITWSVVGFIPNQGSAVSTTTKLVLVSLAAGLIVIVLAVRLRRIRSARPSSASPPSGPSHEIP